MSLILLHRLQVSICHGVHYIVIYNIVCGACVAQRLCNGLPRDGPEFDSCWERCPSQGTVNGGDAVNDLAVDGTLNTTNNIVCHNFQFPLSFQYITCNVDDFISGNEPSSEMLTSQSQKPVWGETSYAKESRPKITRNKTNLDICYRISTIFNKSCTYITFNSAVKHRHLSYSYPRFIYIHIL